MSVYLHILYTICTPLGEIYYLQQIVIKPGTRTPPPTPSSLAGRGLRCTLYDWKSLYIQKLSLSFVGKIYSVRLKARIVKSNLIIIGKWRERDSNPRIHFCITDFPGLRLQPLGHLSSCLALQSYNRIKKKATFLEKRFFMASSSSNLF